MLSALILPLFAQESDSEDEDEGLEVVITTATKTEGYSQYITSCNSFDRQSVRAWLKQHQRP